MDILLGVWGALVEIIKNSGYAFFFTDGGYLNLIMIGVSFFFLWLGIKKGFEPLLMIPIAFGMLLANIPGANLAVQYNDLQGFIDLVAGRMVNDAGQVCTPGLLDFLYFGVKAGIYPPLIFLGIGAMTDFSPLIANPSSFILGAAAQLGIFFTYVGAILLKFTPAGGRLHRHYRRRGRPHGHFRNFSACAGNAWHNRGRGLFVYGARAGDSAAHHARAYNKKRAQRGYGYTAPCFKT